MPAKKATKKTAPKKATGRKAAAAKKPELSVRNIVMAQLGLYGAIYDRAQEQLEAVQKKAPGQFNTLIKRGEKAQKELRKEVKRARKEFKTDAAEMRDKVEDMVEDVRGVVGV